MANDRSVTTRMTSTSSSRSATFLGARDMYDRDFLSAPAWAAAAVKGPSQGSRVGRSFSFFSFPVIDAEEIEPPRSPYIIYMSNIRRGKFRCLISLSCAVIPIFFRLPVAVAPGHVRINLFYITHRERQRQIYKNRKEEKRRQYIHDQVVRHVWISGTCTRILSSFSALPVLCCCDYSFAVCRRRARINSTPLFHFAHFSPLIDIRQGSEPRENRRPCICRRKEVFPSSSLLSLLLVFAHIFASLLALPSVLTLWWPTTGNKKK